MGAPGCGCRAGPRDTCCIPPYGTAGGTYAGGARGTPGPTTCAGAARAGGGRGRRMRMQRTRCRHCDRRCWGSRHRMLRQHRERSWWLLLGTLLSRMLVGMVMVMSVEGKCNSRVHMVVREMVLHRGNSQGVVEQVMVMVVLMGSEQRERHWQDASGWRHREPVRARCCLPLPARRPPSRLSPALCILQPSNVILQMSE